MPLHSPMEIAVLRALRAGKGWMAAAEVADVIDLPIYGTRATLISLRRRFLVARGGSVHGHWGEWSITEHGLLELSRSEQLRLIV